MISFHIFAQDGFTKVLRRLRFQDLDAKSILAVVKNGYLYLYGGVQSYKPPSDPNVESTNNLLGFSKCRCPHSFLAQSRQCYIPNYSILTHLRPDASKARSEDVLELEKEHILGVLVSESKRPNERDSPICNGRWHDVPWAT